MPTESDLAAYGEFNIAYALLDTTITNAITYLLRNPDPQIAAELFYVRMTLGRRLDVLQKLANKLKNAHRLRDENVPHLLDAIKRARDISKWRNDRIHARVRYEPRKLAVSFTGKTGEDLDIEFTDCREKQKDAIDVEWNIGFYADGTYREIESRQQRLTAIENAMSQENDSLS
jgi:hypothetical protein